MKRRLLLLCSAVVLLLSMSASKHLAGQMTGCQQPQHANPTNAIYHWKTLFNPSAEELAFLEEHDVGRLYIRMFDIAPTRDDKVYDYVLPAPIATTRFDAPIPEGIEVIPTTYITLDALRLMEGSEAYYAQLIVDRLLAMASYNECGEISEVQFDCDWTESTFDIYTALTANAKSYLNDQGIELSITIRVHQVDDYEWPAANRGVVMLYNTGAIKHANTRNSILDVVDVMPYVRNGRNINVDIPLDYAFPTFGWGVKFRNGEFHSIVSDPQSATLGEGETIRGERPTVEEVLTVKELFVKAFGEPYQSNIIYHLDNEELKNYTNDEISQIFSRN